MRLPIPFSGSWNWTTRGLVYIISWLGPSNVLPIPIAQVVFPIEQAGRYLSLVEVGAKYISNRTCPTAQTRKILALNSRLRERVKRGNISVTIDELIHAEALDQLIQNGFVHFESLTDMFCFTQLPNGNYQFTLTWMTTHPNYYLLHTNHAPVYMPVDGEGGIQVSETFEVTAQDFESFVIDLANNVERKINAVKTRHCIGTTPDKFSKWFDKDPGAGGGSGNILSHQLLIRKARKEDVFKNRRFQKSDYSTNIAVKPSSPDFGKSYYSTNIAIEPYSTSFGKPPSRCETFVGYFFIALILLSAIAKGIKKLVEKYNEKK